MALQSSGAISLNEIHIEAGGSSGTSCTINDSDIRGLISASSEAEMDFADWYGASAVDPFQFDTSSPATLNASSFSMNVDSETGGLVRVATRLNLTFNSGNIGMTIDDVRFSGPVGGSTGLQNGMSQANVNYSNTDDIASIQTRWVLNNINVDFRDSNSDEHIKTIHLVGTGSENSTVARAGTAGDDTSFDFTGSWVTVTPALFGGSQSNSQSHMLELQADSSSSSQVAKSNIKGGSGGYIEFQVRVNKSSGGSSTFSYRQAYTSAAYAGVDYLNAASYFADD